MFSQVGWGGCWLCLGVAIEARGWGAWRSTYLAENANPVFGGTKESQDISILLGGYSTSKSALTECDSSMQQWNTYYNEVQAMLFPAGCMHVYYINLT